MGVIMVYKPTYNWGSPSCTQMKKIWLAHFLLVFPLPAAHSSFQERHDGHGQGEVAIQDESGVTRRAGYG